MNASLGRVAVGCLLCWLATQAQTPTGYRIEGLPPAASVAVPIPVTLSALNAAGAVVEGFSGELSLSAVTRDEPGLVFSEFSADGETVELLNVGRHALPVGGWELEAVPASGSSLRQRSQVIPDGTVVPPGQALIWTSKAGTGAGAPEVVSPKPLNAAPERAAVWQIRDGHGRVVDQVVFAGSLSRPVELIWTGPSLTRTATNRHRVGFENQWTAGDWLAAPGSLGRAHPQLRMPWLGMARPAVCTPERIALLNGQWTGSVTFGTPGERVTLRAGAADGRLTESAPITVLPFPALGLALPLGDSAAEAAPGTVLPLRVRLPAALATNAIVALESAVPGEFTVPPTVTIPAGELEATVGLTNHDDPEADGRAAVKITATAFGHASATITAFNDDNEPGRLLVRLPEVALEDSGRQLDPGWVFLESPAHHEVEVALTGNALVRVPPTLTIPAGQSGAPFPLYLLDDGFVNPNPRRLPVGAQIPGWIPASAELRVADDDPREYSFEWPADLTEGTPAQLLVRLAAPRDYALTVQATNSDGVIRLLAPATIPAGATEFSVELLVPNDDAVGSYGQSEVCVQVSDDLRYECRKFIPIDDEYRIVGVHEFYPPLAVFSGQPFELTVGLASTSRIPADAETPGQLTTTAPLTAAVATDSVAIRFQGNQHDGPVVLTGESLGVQLEVTAAGFSRKSRPLDLIRGFVRTNQFQDLVGLPGTERLLVAVGSLTNATGLLWELDAATGAVVRELALPEPVRRLSISPSGQSWWAALKNSRIVRLNPATGVVEQEVALSPVPGDLAVKALLSLGDDGNRVLALAGPADANGTEDRLVVYANGVRLPETAEFPANEFANRLISGRTAGEAFAQGRKVARLNLTEQGVAVTHEIALQTDQSGQNLTLYGDDLLFGNGFVLAADTLTWKEFLPGTMSTILPVPERNLLLSVDQSQILTLLDATTRQRVGGHWLPAPSLGPVSAYPGTTVRCGPNRWAQLLAEGRQLRVWECPLLAPTPADLAVTVETTTNPAPAWEFVVRNGGPGTAHGVELSFEGMGISPFGFGSLAAGETRRVPVSLPAGAGIHWALGTVRASTTDPTPANNQALATLAIPLPAAPMARVLTLGFVDIGSAPDAERLYALVKPPPAGGPASVTVIDPARGVVERSWPVDDEPRALRISADGASAFVQNGARTISRWNIASAQREATYPATTGDLLDFAPVPDGSGRVVVVTRNRIGLLTAEAEVAGFTLAAADFRQVGFFGDRVWTAWPGRMNSYRVTSDGLGSGATYPINLVFDNSRWTGDSRHIYFGNGAFAIATRTEKFGYSANATAPDAAGRMFTVLGQSLRRHDPETLQSVAEEVVPAAYLNLIRGLWRWGRDGVAIWSDSHLLMFRSVLVKQEGSADLSVSTGLARPLALGAPISFAVTVTNRGPDTARRVRVTVSLDRDPRIVSTDPPTTPGLARLFFEFGELPAGAVTNALITAEPAFSSINASVEVAAETADPNPAGNLSWFSGSYFPPNGEAALAGGSTTVQRPQPDGTFAVRMFPRNLGPAPLAASSLIVSRLEGVELVSTSPGIISTNCCDQWHWIGDLPPIPAGQDLAVDALFRIHSAGLHRLVWTLHADLNQTNLMDNVAATYVYLAPTNPPPVTEFNLPGRVLRWSEPRQQLVANFGDGLMLLAKDTFEPVQYWPTPGETAGLELTDDGNFAWVAVDGVRLTRINLNTGAADLVTAWDSRLAAIHGAFAPMPGQPDTVVAVGLMPEGGRIRAMAARGGQALPEMPPPMDWWGNGARIAISPSGRIFAHTGAQLRELSLTAGGLQEVRNLDAAAMYAFDPTRGFVFVGSRLHYGDGRATDVDAGTRLEGLLPGYPDPMTGRLHVVWAEYLSTHDRFTLRSHELPEQQPRWQVSFEAPRGRFSGNTIPLGSYGYLLDGEKLRLFREQDFAPRRVNPGLAAALVEPPLGTNVVVTVQLTVTNPPPWVARNLQVRIEPSAGLAWIPATGSTAGQNVLALGPVATFTNLNLEFRTLAAGPQSVRFTLEGDSGDEEAANNSAEIRLDVPTPPRLRWTDVAGPEQTGFRNGLQVPVFLDRPAPADLTLTFNRRHLTTQADDFSITTTTAQFPRGTATALISVVAADNLPEPDERFELTFADGPVIPPERPIIVTLINDDLPQVTPRSATIAEGNAGFSELRVPVVLAQALTTPFEVAFSTDSATATSGEDFIPQVGRLLFAPGTRTNFVRVPIMGDTQFESAESLWIVLSDAMATFTVNRISAAITNDDAPTPPAVTLTQTPAGKLRFVFPTQAGAIYRIETALKISLPSWSRLPGALTGTGSPGEMELTPANDAARFYRIVAE